MEGLPKLKALRKAFRSHLTSICGKIGELDLTKPEEEITTLVLSYLDQLQWKAETIGSLDSKIVAEIENTDDLEQDVFEAEKIKDTIIEKTTRLKRYLELNKPSSETSAVARSISTPSSASRLPKLSLPKFSRDPIKWQSFWDSFEAAVHTNTNLTGVEKLNYLRAQL